MQPPTAARTIDYHSPSLVRDFHFLRVMRLDAVTLWEPRLHYAHEHTFDHYHFHEDDDITTTFTVLSRTLTLRIFGPRPWDPPLWFGPCESTSSHEYNHIHHHHHHPPPDEPVDHELPNLSGPKRAERAARVWPVVDKFFYSLWFDPEVEPEQEPASRQDPEVLPPAPANTWHFKFVFNTRFSHKHFHCRNGDILTATEAETTTETFETFLPNPLSDDHHPLDHDPPKILGDCSYIVHHTHEHETERAEESPPTPPPPGIPEWF